MNVLVHSAVGRLRAGRPEAALAPAGMWIATGAIGWGALGFGAVYPWAYWPLAAACLACGAIGIASDRTTRVSGAHRALAFSLSGFAVAVVIQLVPLPVAWLEQVSPATSKFLRAIDPVFAAGMSTAHPLSIRPGDTLVGLALFAAFAVFLFGLVRLLSHAGSRRLVEAITILGVLLALVGIVQKPLYAGRLYGFWTPVFQGDPFGPFVNKNHFAGWMLLALPLTMSLLCAGVENAMRRVKPGWRYRVLWLSSPEASKLVMIAAGGIVMALSLVLTMSRSGMTAFALALFVTGVFVIGRQSTWSRKVVVAGYLLMLTIVVAGWVGMDAIATRFSDTDWTEFNNRKGAWLDATSVVRDFPVAGTGLNTYGTATLVYQKYDLGSHYVQSHNDYLQLAAEGGLLLWVPAACVLFFFARDAARRLRRDTGTTAWWLRAGAVTALVAIAIQETVDFSLQIPGNTALFVVACAIALHDPAPQSPDAPQRHGSIHAGRGR